MISLDNFWWRQRKFLAYLMCWLRRLQVIMTDVATPRATSFGKILSLLSLDVCSFTTFKQLNIILRPLWDCEMNRLIVESGRNYKTVLSALTPNSDNVLYLYCISTFDCRRSLVYRFNSIYYNATRVLLHLSHGLMISPSQFLDARWR